MRLIVDGDACPVKDLVWRAAQRLGLPMLLVSNSRMAFGEEPGVTAVIVAQGPDVADAWIVDAATPEDLVITADIPLADQVVRKGGLALGHRGEVFDESTIGDRMATWTLHRQLRESGMEIGGPKPYGPKDRQLFSNELEKLLRKLAKRQVRGSSPPAGNPSPAPAGHPLPEGERGLV